jgi:hypothetical protein
MWRMFLVAFLCGTALWIGTVSGPRGGTIAVPDACAVTSPDSPEKRDCCSHPGGVCGCGGTRLQCCDGTLSPTCPC